MAQFQKQLTALSREMNRLDRFYHQFAKQHAINYNQLIILYELYTQGQCTQKQIRESGLSPSKPLTRSATGL